jgi:hypothetical protein
MEFTQVQQEWALRHCNEDKLVGLFIWRSTSSTQPLQHMYKIGSMFGSHLYSPVSNQQKNSPSKGFVQCRHTSHQPAKFTAQLGLGPGIDLLCPTCLSLLFAPFLLCPPTSCIHHHVLTSSFLCNNTTQSSIWLSFDNQIDTTRLTRQRSCRW